MTEKNNSPKNTLENTEAPWYKTTLAKIGAGVLAASVATATIVGLALPKGDGNFTDSNDGKTPSVESTFFPSPQDPNYDSFAEISSKNKLTIGDVDRLLGYFTSSEVSRESLINALSQASQEEIDRILFVVEDYDTSNNDEVTTLLNKYGLITSEVPVDLLGRISEKNDLTVQELDTVAFELYGDIAYSDIQNALADFSQDEINTTRNVLNGTESSVVLNNLLRAHGINLGDEYLK